MRKKKTRSILPLIMIVLGAILMIGAVVVFVNYSPEPDVIITPTPAAIRIPFPEVPRVTLSEAKAAHESGSAVFIDTRGEPYFSQGHIPGALSITQEELPGRLGELSKSDWIIPYCT